MKKLLILALLLLLATPAMAVIKTQLVDMHLEAPNPYSARPIVITLDETRPSYGMVGEDFPAESFFDIYPKVIIPQFPGDTIFVLKLGSPGIHMSATLASLPPPEDTTYRNEGDVKALLASGNAADVALGVILEVQHKVGPILDSLELEGGGIRETFENSTADLGIEFSDGEVIDIVGAIGTFTVDRGIQYVIPSVTGYGIAVLALLLLGTGLYVFYRRRRAVAA